MECNDVMMTKKKWNRVLKDIQLAVEAAADHFNITNQQALTDALNTFQIKYMDQQVDLQQLK
jgi:hypothetical protein